MTSVLGGLTLALYAKRLSLTLTLQAGKKGKPDPLLIESVVGKWCWQTRPFLPGETSIVCAVCNKQWDAKFKSQCGHYEPLEVCSCCGEDCQNHIKFDDKDHDRLNVQQKRLLILARVCTHLSLLTRKEEKPQCEMGKRTSGSWHHWF